MLSLRRLLILFIVLFVRNFGRVCLAILAECSQFCLRAKALEFLPERSSYRHKLQQNHFGALPDPSWLDFAFWGAPISVQRSQYPLK